MAHNLKPDLEPEAQLLRQQIAELTKANVALQTELAECRRTEVALRTEVARVYQELNKLKRAEQLARRQTAALTHTLEELTKNSELNRFLGQVLFAITEQLDVPLSAIWLVDSNKENAWLHMMCHEGQILNGEQQLGHPNATMPDPIADSGAWQAVYSARRPVIHDNIANNPVFKAPQREWLLAHGIKTLLSVPLLLGSEVIGKLTLSLKRGGFTAEAIELTQALAHQVTLAIQLTRLAEQAQQSAVLEERNRIAREIHDNLAQGFTGVVVQLEGAEKVLTKAPEKALARIDRARQLARESLSEARRSVRALRPQALEAGDLVRALSRLAERMTEDTPVRASFQVRGTHVSLPSNIESDLLRIGQEALTNVIKHAHTTSVRIDLAYELQEICLSVQDDGQGFDLNSQRHKGNSQGESFRGGFGLTSIRERAERMGGRLTITSQLGQGTTVSVAVPVLSQTLPHNHKLSHHESLQVEAVAELPPKGEGKGEY